MKKPIRKKISKTSILKNTTIESDDVSIDDKAKLEGVFIKAKKVIIKANVVLTNCKLFSDGIVYIGKDSVIKENTVINAFRGIGIGNRTIIDRDVIIGGMQSHKSEIEIGNDCVILYRSYINTTRKISIKNNVGIGGYNLIFSHSAWQNVLEGNPYKFADVTIRDNVWLPWNVTVMPGITIGRNATIGSGSVITKDIPPNVFAAGVPARIIRTKASRKPSDLEKDKIVREILTDFDDYITKFSKIPNRTLEFADSYKIITKNNSLIYTTKFKNFNAKDIIVSFRIPEKLKSKHEWIELDSKKSKINTELAKNFVTFIRRYGIKITS